MSWNLNNKVAIVTGGTRGIGLSIVNELLSLGAIVYVIARNENELNLNLETWTEKNYQVHGIIADLTKFDSFDEILASINVKKIDILVNNVGGNYPKKFIDYNFKEVYEIFNLNLFSAIFFTQKLFKFLKASPSAVVINITSIAGFEDVGTGSMYAVAKAALIQFTKSIAVEWAPFNIRVNSVAPWFTSTGRINTLLKDANLNEFVLSNTPLQKIAEPQDIANAVAFLAMNKSSYITGETIVVDGGFRANSK